MSASCYTHRIKVKTQARNAKVQYPGRRAMYDGIHATCAVNPDFTVLNYNPIPLCCPVIITPIIPISPCLPSSNSILNGVSSSSCILDGGFSNSNYTPVLDGGNSSL
jgi:hypothetical protein